MTERPVEIIRWQDIEAPEAFIYDGHDEPMCIDANYSRHFGFARLDIHHIRVEPGHPFLNNTDSDVELLVVGDRPLAANRNFYPVNPERLPLRSDWCDNHPQRPLGPHDGRTGMRRGT